MAGRRRRPGYRPYRMGPAPRWETPFPWEPPAQPPGEPAASGATLDRLTVSAVRPGTTVLRQTFDLTLQLGRDLHRWGPGGPGALGGFVLSEHAGPLDALRVAAAGDRLRGLKLLAPLEDGRWLHGLRYDWLPTATLRVGLSETVVTASGVYAPYVLTPVPFVAYWLSLRARRPAGFDDKVNLALDLDWRPRPGTALYVEAYVDDYTAPGNPFPSRLGGAVGIYLVDLFRDGRTALRLEHVRATNWIYTTTGRAADYTCAAAAWATGAPRTARRGRWRRRARPWQGARGSPSATPSSARGPGGWGTSGPTRATPGRASSSQGWWRPPTPSRRRCAGSPPMRSRTASAPRGRRLRTPATSPARSDKTCTWCGRPPLDSERNSDIVHDPAQDPSLEQEPTLRDYLDVFLRRWWLVAACVIILAATALGFSIASPPVYRAQTSVVVDRGGSSLGLVPDITGISQQTFVDTLAEIVKSRAVLSRAVRLLGVEAAAAEEALDTLRRGLKVQRARNTDLILIQAEGPTPSSAAANTNAVGRAFLQWHLEARRSQARAGREFIEGRLSALSGELRAAEDALARYKVEGGQVSLSEQTTLVLEKLADFEAQRRAAEAERQGVEASLRRVRTALAQQAPTVAATVLQGEDPVATQLRSDLAKLEVELVGLRKQFTDRHPQVIATRARIEEVKGRLRQQAAQTLLSRQITLNPLHQDLAAQAIRLEVERQALQARETALSAAAAAYAGDLKRLPPKEVELARLTRNLKVAEETYLLLSGKLQEARIAEASIVGDLRIVDAAVPPATPVRPRVRLNTLFGALLGLMVGAGAAFLSESLDVTFKTAEEAARYLRLPLLAAVPLVHRRRNEQDGHPLLTTSHPRSPFAEAFRHLRTNLLYTSPDRPLRLLLITSPGPGEAKSTVAVNLAVALAQAGRRVWLVEADLRKPTLAWTLGPEGTLGLTDLLVDGWPVDRALRGTEVDNLWFVPSGTIPPTRRNCWAARRCARCWRSR